MSESFAFLILATFNAKLKHFCKKISIFAPV